MRTFPILIAFLSLIALPAEARTRRGTLYVALSDATPFTIEVNGRRFDRTGTSLTIGDLPPGRHDLRVYAVSTSRYGKRNADLVYTGTVRLLARGLTRCTIDPVRRTARVQVLAEEAARRSASGAPRQPGAVRDNAAPLATAHADPGTAPASAPLLTSAALQRIEDAAARKPADREKLDVIQTALADERFSTDDVRRAAGLLTFEDTRLQFAAWAQPRVTDPEAFAGLESLFEIAENRDAFLRSLTR